MKKLLFLLIVLSLTPTYTYAGKLDLYRGTYIYNFTRFVKWPTSVPKDHFKICTLGDDPVLFILEKIKKKKKKKSKTPIEIVQREKNDPFTDCHILYISTSFVGSLSTVLGKVEEKAVLTVSSHKGFAEKGGIVELKEKDKKIKITVNYEAMKKSSVVIDAELLGIVEIINMKR